MDNSCPTAAQSKYVNLANHLVAIEEGSLGPADPRQPSTEYWADKMDIWGVTEGVARTRLCMNCAHYDNSPATMECLAAGTGATLKPSKIPVVPVWADIKGMPSAICTEWNITCSALRTCDAWEDARTDPDNANVDYKSIEKAAETYKPTDGMATAAKRALNWHKEGRRGGTLVGLARANQLVAKENLSESTVLRMYSFFARHEVDKQATGFHSGEEGYPSPGRVAWDLWGGDAGQTWSKAKRDQIMNNRD
jgi:hypothetical protein